MGEEKNSNSNANGELLTCENCDRTVTRDAVIRTETYGDLDPDRWQSLCCPDCGRRLKTVFVPGG